MSYYENPDDYDIFKDTFMNLEIRSAFHCLFDHYLPAGYGNNPRVALQYFKKFLETEKIL